MTISLKLKKNRKQFASQPRVIAIFAKKLFESVGMHSKFDGRNDVSMFDQILGILSALIEEQSDMEMSQGEMEVDS